MDIQSNIYKLFLVFSLTLVFMISSCSEPPENKEQPSKQIAEKTQAEKTKVETPAPVTTEPESPAPETQKSEATAPPAPKTAAPKPEPAKPEPPKPVLPEPAKESNFIDVITMDNPAYSKHKKSIVLFTHKKHIKEYKIDCGACHHDKNGAPLTGLKEKDGVDSCISCHTKPGQAPRPKNKKKLSLKEKLEYHAEAIHENCIKCHKEYNKKNDTKAAPASCSKCHPKKK
jgi:type IV secretory pathway VirB10-like protein